MIQTLQEIEGELLNAEKWKKTLPLDRNMVRRWMNDNDIEALVNQLLFLKEHLRRVVPALSLDEIVRFLQKQSR